MANQTLMARHKLAKRTEAEWIALNPVILDGEIAISSDKNNDYKVGDGSSTWSQLKYMLAGFSHIVELTEEEYKALPPSKLSDDILYAITDSAGALTAYYTKSETDTRLAKKQDKLIAGEGIEIDPETNEISSTGGGSATIDYGTTEEFEEWKKTAQDGESFFITDDYEGGGGGKGDVGTEITYAQWEAMSDEQKNSGTYWITDVEATNPEALTDLDTRVEILENTIEKQGDWTIQKFNDGRLYQTYLFDANITSWTAWGVLYESNRLITDIQFPYSFTNYPSVNTNIPGIALAGIEIRYDKDNLLSLYALRPNTSGPLASYKIVIEARGFWK